jgi:hypothetical protein
MVLCDLSNSNWVIASVRQGYKLVRYRQALLEGFRKGLNIVAAWHVLFSFKQCTLAVSCVSNQYRGLSSSHGRRVVAQD